MSKTDDQVRSEISDNEAWAEWGAWAVVAGLVLEIGLATAKSLGCEYPNIENWGAVVADSLIALGVYAEIHFGRLAARGNSELLRRSDERVAEANAIAAAAQKDAAEARERTAEIERITSWRNISIEQRDQIAASIKNQIKGIEVWVQFERVDPEAFRYANDISGVFLAAGAKSVRGDGNYWMVDGAPVFGIVVASRDDFELGFVIDGFRQVGVELHTNPRVRRIPYLQPGAVFPDLYIFVGAKPPPVFQTLPSVTSVGMTQSENERAAAQDERAAALERSAAPRCISPEQHARIVSALRDGLPLTPEQRERRKVRRNEGEEIILQVFVEVADDP